jgi:hypothetical protein
MSKRAAFYDRCKTLYVEDGYAIPAIVAMVQKDHPDAPTRRTIQNWSDDGGWPEKRKTFADQEDDLFEVTREVAEMAGRNARENPTPENINSFVRILSVLKYKEQIRDMNEPAQKEDELSDKDKAKKILQLIDKELTG